MAKKNPNKIDTTTKNKSVNSELNDDNHLNRQNGNNLSTKPGNSSQISKEEALKALRLMLVGRSIDNKAMNLLKQGKTFFHIAGSGHEAIQVAAGLALNPKKDWFFPYYRDVSLSQAIGVTPYDFFLQCFAKDDDPSSGGRQ